MAYKGMKFGIFLAPFHRVGENPTLVLARDIERRWQLCGDGFGVGASNAWARGHRKTIFSPNVEAVRRAYVDAGREVPTGFRQRTSGGRDVEAPRT